MSDDDLYERVFTTEDEAADEADHRNSEQDEITWQTAYLNNGDGTGAWIVVEGDNDED